MNRLPVIVRQHIAAFRALLVFTVLCGLIYPAVMVGFSQLAVHNQANLPVSTVKDLVATYTQGRVLGFLGEPAVNVLELNIALDQLSAKSGG